jgi:hypothetical protein
VVIMAAASDYGKEVADIFRGIKQDFEKKPIADRSEGKTPQAGTVDPSVREQVISDIDHLIEKHEDRKPFPGFL